VRSPHSFAMCCMVLDIQIKLNQKEPRVIYNMQLTQRADNCRFEHPSTRSTGFGNQTRFSALANRGGSEGEFVFFVPDSPKFVPFHCNNRLDGMATTALCGGRRLALAPVHIAGGSVAQLKTYTQPPCNREL